MHALRTEPSRQCRQMKLDSLALGARARTVCVCVCVCARGGGGGGGRQFDINQPKRRIGGKSVSGQLSFYVTVRFMILISGRGARGFKSFSYRIIFMFFGDDSNTKYNPPGGGQRMLKILKPSAAHGKLFSV